MRASLLWRVRPTFPKYPDKDEAPRAFAERMAREKALAAFDRQSKDFVLGADTIVVLDSEILGKPCDNADAARMLRLLSGRTHQVITGVCLLGRQLGGNQKEKTFEDAQSETTTVTMNDLGEAEIQSYILSGEPMDKAGAYAIQGRASRWISRIEGDYFNVVGLPVSLVCRMMQKHGAL